MHTERDWVRAVCERPDDDYVRLVFADWLDEQGRSDDASRIRHQVADPDRVESAVLDSVSRSKRLPFAAYRRRGFVFRIELPADDFLRHAPTLFASHPIQEVRLTDCYPNHTDEPEVGDAPAVWQKRSITQDSWEGHWRARRYGVPDVLLELMPFRDWKVNYTQDRSCTYPPNAETGLMWLSNACVAFGRERAGLPLLSVVG